MLFLSSKVTTFIPSKQNQFQVYMQSELYAQRLTVIAKQGSKDKNIHSIFAHFLISFLRGILMYPPLCFERETEEINFKRDENKCNNRKIYCGTLGLLSGFLLINVRACFMASTLYQYSIPSIHPLVGGIR